MDQKQIYKSMINILKDVDAISKAKTNVQQNYKFRGIDDMYNALHDIFAKHEVFITSEVMNEKREERTTQKGGVLLYAILDVKFTCWAQDGSSIYSVMKGEAMDSGDKASNKAMSTALKYFLMQTLLIPTEDQLDTEYESHEVKPKNEVSEVSEDYVETMKFKTRDLTEYSKNYFRSLKYTLPEVYKYCEPFGFDAEKIEAHIKAL